MKRILQFIVAIMIPLVAFCLANRRHLEIAWDFSVYEIRVHLSFLLYSTLFLCVLFIILFISMRRNNEIVLILLIIKSRVVENPWLPWALAAFLIGSFLPYMHMRYRIYSESAYQRSAVKRLESGDLRGARLLCERYLDLYPQRRADGRLPDPVCVPLLDLFGKMSRIDSYLRDLESEASVLDGLPVPIDWNAKRYGRFLSDRWSGRCDLDASDASVAPVAVKIPEKLFEWLDMARSGFEGTGPPRGKESP